MGHMSKEYFVADKHRSVGDVFLIDDERRNYVRGRVIAFHAIDRSYNAYIHNYVINNILTVIMAFLRIKHNICNIIYVIVICV